MSIFRNVSVSLLALAAFSGAPASAQNYDHTYQGRTGNPNVGTVRVRPAAPVAKFFPPPPPPPITIGDGGSTTSGGGSSEGGNSAHDSDSNGRDDGRDADAAGAASGPDSTGPDGGPGW